MRSTRKARSLARAQEKDRVLLELFKSKAPYEEIQRALAALERKWLREARTATERVQIRRGIAEDTLSQAFAWEQPWAEFGRRLRHVQRLGYSTLALRVHVACLFVQALPSFPKRAQEAWKLLREAELRVRRLPKERPLRREHLRAIAHAKREVGWPLSPDEEAILLKRPSQNS